MCLLRGLRAAGGNFYSLQCSASKHVFSRKTLFSKDFLSEKSSPRTAVSYLATTTLSGIRLTSSSLVRRRRKFLWFCAPNGIAKGSFILFYAAKPFKTSAAAGLLPPISLNFPPAAGSYATKSSKFSACGGPLCRFKSQKISLCH